MVLVRRKGERPGGRRSDAGVAGVAGDAGVGVGAGEWGAGPRVGDGAGVSDGAGVDAEADAGAGVRVLVQVCGVSLGHSSVRDGSGGADGLPPVRPGKLRLAVVARTPAHSPPELQSRPEPLKFSFLLDLFNFVRIWG